MINIYTPEEQQKVRKAGKILAEVLQKTVDQAIAGKTTAELDKFADELIEKSGAKPSFKMEKGYHWATCMNINDVVVHGIPGKHVLKNGDKLGIDVGLCLDGFHADTATTIMIGEEESEFLAAGKKTLDEVIKLCQVGNRVGQISQFIQQKIEGAGYSVVKQLVGHGVGRNLHEDPEVPNYLRGEIKNTPFLKEGMIIAVEIIYNMGKSPIVYGNNDGWTIVTRDFSLSGLFEHTILITKNGPVIATTS